MKKKKKKRYAKKARAEPQTVPKKQDAVCKGQKTLPQAFEDLMDNLDRGVTAYMQGKEVYQRHNPGGIVMPTYRCYKFRLYPDDYHMEFLERHFGCVRFVYNYFLRERITQYNKTLHSDGYPAQSEALKELKKKDDFIWLNEVYSQSLQCALKDLDRAYENFFHYRASFPNFHSKKRKNSFTVPQNAWIEGGKLWLPKFMTGIPILMHREIRGRIGRVTISKNPQGEYYASISTTEECGWFGPTDRFVGVDLGLKALAILSDGVILENHKYLKKYEIQLAKAQRDLSRKEIGSRRAEKQRLKVARLYRKVANCRKDYLHKCSRFLVDNYDIICLENLNVTGLLKNHKLAKWIADASWGTFVTMVTYKANMYGRQVVKIPRYHPSSQTCSNCGYINKETKDLSVRKWVCPQCGELHDRDQNASINILYKGIEILYNKK